MNIIYIYIYTYIYINIYSTAIADNKIVRLMVTCKIQCNNRSVIDLSRNKLNSNILGKHLEKSSINIRYPAKNTNLD